MEFACPFLIFGRKNSVSKHSDGIETLFPFLNVKNRKGISVSNLILK